MLKGGASALRLPEVEEKLKGKIKEKINTARKQQQDASSQTLVLLLFGMTVIKTTFEGNPSKRSQLNSFEDLVGIIPS